MLTGYPDGSFRPPATTTRAEFAVIAVRFEFDGDVSTFTLNQQSFSDIRGHWAEDFITMAYSLGYVNGFEDGTFRPHEPITRAQVTRLLNNVLERRVESEDDLVNGIRTWVDNPRSAWYYFDIIEATNSHYFSRKPDGITEIWSELRANPDWAVLQRPNSRPGDVVY
jgi:hypothetical protein